MNPREQARAFLWSIYEKVAHGDEQHRKWLADELLAWTGALERVLQEMHLRGVNVERRFNGKQPQKEPECDECDGSGVYFLNGVAQGCICSEPQV